MAAAQNDNFEIRAGKPIDSRYLKGIVPYASVAEANASIPLTYRHSGLPVLIGNDEYWYRNGITDGDLVLKQTGVGGGDQTIQEVLTEGNDAGGLQIKNIGDPTADQDADTRIARNAAITSAVNALLDSVPTAGNTLNKLYSLIQAIVGVEGAEAFNASGGAFPTTFSGGAIKKGRSYRITVGGTLGSINQKTVNPEDLLIANVDNPTNNGNDWQVVESNRDQATSAILGLVKLYVNTGGNTDGTMDQNSLTNLFNAKSNKLALTTVNVAGATITCNLSGEESMMFVGNASFGTPKAIALTNDGNKRVMNFVFVLTSVTAVLTFPSIFTMQQGDSRWNDSTHEFTPNFAGKHEFSAIWDGTDMLLKASTHYY